MNATQLAAKIISGINSGAFPSSSLRMTAKQMRDAYPVTAAVACEAAMILADNFQIA